MYIATPQHVTDHFRIEKVPPLYMKEVKNMTGKGLDKQYNKLVPDHMR